MTKLRDYLLVGEDATRGPAKLETFQISDDADDFLQKPEKPRALSAPLALVSYARDGLARVEAAGDVSAFATVRAGLENASDRAGDRTRWRLIVRSAPDDDCSSSIGSFSNATRP